MIKFKYGSTPDKFFNKVQLAKGIKVEMEHTKNKSIAKQIAKGHLAGESKNYYVYLSRMEKLMDKHKKKFKRKY